MNEALAQTLRTLRLSGMATTLDVRMQEAAGNGLNHEEFLELALQDEIEIRKQRLLARRIKNAAFRDKKTLEEFDWTFNVSIQRKQVFDLATCHFIEEARDILFMGPPGVGKSHLAQALGYQAIKMGRTVLYRSIFDLVRDFLKDEAFNGEERVLNRYLKPELLIVDDRGMKELPKHSGEFLFEVIMRRHENRSTIMTSNRPIEDWGKLLQDVPSATAILDRFLQHADIFTGQQHAGEHLASVLEKRAKELSPPIQRCDRLSRNTSPEFEAIVVNCIPHSLLRRPARMGQPVWLGLPKRGHYQERCADKGIHALRHH